MKKQKQVLILGTSDNYFERIEKECINQNFAISFQRATSKEQFQKKVIEGNWDIILTDYLIPSFGGKDALIWCSENNIEIPIVMVTDKIGEKNAVEVMKSGVKDIIYLDSLSDLIPAIKHEVKIVEDKTTSEQLFKNDIFLEKYQMKSSQFESLLQNSTDYILISDEKAKPVIWNNAYEKLMHEAFDIKMKPGLQPHTFIKNKADREYWKNLHKRVLGGESFRAEYNYVFPSGKKLYFEVSYTPIFQKNEVIGFSEITRDITKQKEIQKQNMENQERFRSMYTHTPIGIAVVGLDYTIQKANQAYCTMLGYTEAELIGKTLADFTHPDDLEMNMTYQKKLQKDEIPTFQIEKRFIHKDGHIVYGLLNACLVHNDAGQPIYFMGNVLDITNWKETKNKLQEINLRMKLATESADIGIWELDLKTNHLIWDSRMHQLYHLDESKFTNNYEAWRKSVYAKDLMRVEKELEYSIKTGTNFDTEFRIVQPDGSLSYIKANAVVVKDEDQNPIRLTGINYDITEQRKAEKELKLTLLATTSGIWSWDFRTNIVSMSASYYTMLGYEPNEFESSYDEWLAHIHPDDRKQADFISNKFLQNKTPIYRNVFRMRKKSGEYAWIKSTGKVVDYDENNKPIYMIGNHEDITLEKIFEEKLKKSEENYRFLVENQNDLIVKINFDYELLFVNERYCKIFGKSKEELIGYNFMNFIEKSHQKAVKDSLENLKNPPNTCQHEELDRTVMGKRWFMWSNRAVLDEKGSIKEIIAVGRDITDLKKAEMNLRESENRFKTMFKNIPDPLLIQYSSNGRVYDANDAALQKYGYTLEEIKKLGPKDFTTTDQYQFIPARFKQMQKMRKIVFESVHKTKDGKTFPVEFHAQSFDFKDKTYIIGVCRDISERKKLDKELHESEVRYRQLVNNMGSCVAIYKPINNGENFVFEEVNRAAEKLSKINRKEVFGKKVTDVFPNVKEMGLFDVFKEVYNSGNPQRHPLQLYQDAHHEEWVENYVFKLPSGKIVAIYEDTSEIHNAMNALKRSEEKYKRLFERASDPTLIIEDNTFVECNEATVEFLGYAHKNEIIGKKPWELSPPKQEDGTNSQEKAILLLKQTLQKGTNRFEWVHFTADGAPKWVDISLTTISGNNKTFIHTIWRDITTLRDTLRALTKSESDYEQLFHEMSSAFALHKMIYDKNGNPIDYRFVKVNYQFEKMLNLKSEDIVGKTVLQILPETEKYWIIAYGKVAKTRKSITIEKYSAAFDKYFEVHAYSPEKDYFAASFYDITKRRKAEQELQENEQNLRTIIENLTGVVYRCKNDEDWTMLFLSDNVLELTGYTKEEILHNKTINFNKIIVAEDRDFVRQKVEQASEKEKHFSIEYRIKKKDGKVRWISEQGVQIKKGNNLILEGYLTDITKRKNAELALKKSEEKYKQYVESAPIGVFIANREGCYVEVNETACRVTGYSRKELIGMNLLALIAPDYQVSAQESFHRCVNEGATHDEIKFLHKNGEEHFWVIDAVQLSEDRFLGFVQDTTDRKNMETLLSESENKYRSVVNYSLEGIFVLQSNRCVYANPAVQSITGYSHEEIQNLFYWEVLHPDDVEMVKKNNKRRLQGEQFPSYDLRFYKKDGELRWATINAAKIDWMGLPAVLCFVQDITERKIAELQVQESEAKFRKIFDHSAAAMLLLDSDFKIVQFNHQTTNILGYPKNNLIGKTFIDITHPDDIEKSKEIVQQLVDNKIDLIKMEKRYITYWGDVIWGLIHASVIWDENKKVKYFIAQIMDITERKNAAEEIRRAYKELQEAEKIGKFAFFVYDIPSHSIWCSENVQSLFGVPAKQIQSLEEFSTYIHPEDKNRFIQVMKQNIHSQRKEISYDVRAINKKQEVLFVHSDGEIFYDNDGKAIVIKGTMQDVTEIRKAQEQIEMDLQEKNVMLKEIHHRVKNNLSIIASLLRLQLRGLDTREQVERAFKECNSRIQSMTLIHEKLYQSENFAKIDYKNYSENLVINLMKTYAVDQNVELVFDISEIFFDIDTAIPLGLILNEAITNSLKYAFRKKQKHILKISLKQVKDQYELIIKDNGVGIPETIDVNKTSSLGLRLIRILTDQLGGTSTIERENGTKISIIFKPRK